MLQLRAHRPHVEPAGIQALLAYVWRDRRIGAAVALGVAASTAAVLAAVMPRGPITTVQALAARAAGLVVGLACGLAMRSRWAMLLAPRAFATVFELRWLTVDGPTVDGVELGTAYGILSLLLGRGFFALVALLPMLLGAASGAALARRLRGQSSSARATGDTRAEP